MIRVNGRNAPVTIYELIGKTCEIELPFLDAFAEGLEAYRNGQCERAELLFGSIASLDPPYKT